MSFRLPRSVAALAIACVAVATHVHAETVYFVSKTNGGLYSFNTSGTSITTVSGTGTFQSPTALALGPDGNLYVGDEAGGGRVARYVIATGSVSTVLSLSGTDPAFTGGPVGPGAIAFRPSGLGGEMLVGRNPQTAFYAYPMGPVLGVSGWGIGGTPTVQNFTSGIALNHSPGLAVAADGTLYVSNALYDTQTFLMPGDVLKFNSSGAYLSQVAADASGSGGLYGPSGLLLSGSSLFIASTMNGNIYRTDLTNANPATNTTLFASTGGDYIGPLAGLADGSLLVGSVSGPAGLIYRFTSTGSLQGAYGNAAYGQIGGVVAVPEPAGAALAAAGCVVLAALRCLRRAG